LDFAVSVFEVYDLNGDGLVTYTEALAVGVRMGYGAELCRRGAQSLMRKAGRPGSGVEGLVIDLPGFVRYLFGIVRDDGDNQPLDPSDADVARLKQIFKLSKILPHETVFKAFSARLFRLFRATETGLDFKVLEQMVARAGGSRQMRERFPRSLLQTATPAGPQGLPVGQRISK
jgi:hypothetical protein